MYRDAFDHAAIGMALVTADGRWAIANPRLCTLLGYSLAELRAQEAVDLIHPEDVEASVELFRSALAGEVDEYHCDTRFMHAEGFTIWAQLSVSVIQGDDGSVRYLVAQVEDMTAFVATRSVLADAEKRFRTAFRHAPIGMAIADLQGRWLEVNDALCEILGYARPELLQMAFSDVTHPDDLGTDTALMHDLIEGRALHGSQEKRYVHRDGHVVWVNRSVSLVRDDDGSPLHFISQVADVTAERMANDRLTYMATHDTLTGLANRPFLLERLRQAQTEAETSQAHVGVVFVDLKGFKGINDQHGHKAGDDVLARIGQRLAAVVHPSDTPARLGGDEFVICLANLATTRDAAEQQAGAAIERIVAAVEAPVDVVGETVSVSAAVGITLSRGASEPPDALIRRADQAMYESRRADPGREPRP
jgi:diguanylate cyclase (GGDEF)-like protein/PAS domain S-box-containing protein